MSPPSTHLFLNKHIIQELLFSRITDDLNRKRIFSLQLTADSSQLTANTLFAGFLTTAASLQHRFRVTLIVSRHSERRQECLVGKTENGTMKRSEESITLNNILPSPLITVIDPSLPLRMTP